MTLSVCSTSKKAIIVCTHRTGNCCSKDTAQIYQSIQTEYDDNCSDVHAPTCMAAANWASFSMVSSAAPLWTLVKTEVLKKYLQFW